MNQNNCCSQPLTDNCSICECSKTSCQYMDIDLAVNLKPTAIINGISVECICDPIITCIENNCNNCCKIMISQRIRVDIPITYRISAFADESTAHCECVSNT